MGVNNDNPCLICGSFYSEHRGDFIFVCSGCQNIFNSAIKKWEMTKPIILTPFSSGTGIQPEEKLFSDEVLELANNIDFAPTPEAWNEPCTDEEFEKLVGVPRKPEASAPDIDVVTKERDEAVLKLTVFVNCIKNGLELGSAFREADNFLTSIEKETP